MERYTAAMAKGSKKTPNTSQAPRVVNRKARHDYHILESFEVGIMLRGTEVKAIRQGQCSIGEAFARIETGRTGRHELWLYQMDIGPYSHAASDKQHARQGRRKLLARKRQIDHLLTETMSKGVTLVPLTLYFNERGIAKIELGVGQGKGRTDKRQTIKKRESDLAIKRAMTRKRIG